MCKKKETYRFYSNLSPKNADKKIPFRICKTTDTERDKPFLQETAKIISPEWLSRIQPSVRRSCYPEQTMPHPQHRLR